jgi:hypothetical protein
MEKINLKLKNNVKEYLLTYLMIAFSGIPVFTADNPIWAISYAIIVLIFLFDKNQKFDADVAIFVGFIVLVYVLQALVYGFFSTVTILTLILKFSYPYFTLKLVGKNFPRYFVNIMYFISITSLIFYALFIISPGFEKFILENVAPYFRYKERNDFYKPHPNFIIYTMNIHDGNLIRNCGPFWEPGGFAVFLFIALLINYAYEKDLFSKKNLIFIITIISTLSTAAIITLVVFFFLLSIIKLRLTYVFTTFVIVIPLFLVFFESQPFLKEKIIRDYEIAKSNNYDDKARNRFTSALLDIQTISERPFLGGGKNNEMRSRKRAYFTYLDHRNNGLTGFAANYGIPYTLIYFWLMFRSLKRFYMFTGNSERLASVAMIIIFLLGSSQVIFEKPLLIVFAYLQILTYFNNKKENHNKILNSQVLEIKK